MSWVERRGEYEQLARSHSPHVILTTKDHWFWRCAAVCLWLASCGRFQRQSFLEDFATTLGPIQAYPRGWESLPKWLVVHESRHTWQCQQFGWLVPVVGWFFGRRMRTWVGLLPMAVVYGCFPLPVLFAWGRMRLELDADCASWKASLENGWQNAEEIVHRAEWMADNVSSAAYLWAWPKRWTRDAFVTRAKRQGDGDGDGNGNGEDEGERKDDGNGEGDMI